MIKANVSLTTVIITSTILLAIGITVIIGTIDLSRASKNSINYELNLMRSTTCLEEALNKLKTNHSFAGTITVPFSDGSCSATVTIAAGGNQDHKQIEIASQVGDYHYATNKLADVSTSPITVSNP